MRSRKYYFLAIPLILALLILFGCKKIDDTPMTITEEFLSGLSEETFTLLEQSPSLINIIARFKRQKIEYVSMVPELWAFNPITDRRKMIKRFGILCSIIAYERIIGEKTQLNDLEYLYQKYIRELNIDPLITSSFEKYLNLFSEKEINDEFFEELEYTLKEEQSEMVNRLKETDEEFLIYYSMGIFVEVSYFHTVLTDDESIFSREAIEDRLQKEQYYLKLVEKLYDSEEYGEFALKFKPVLDIFLYREYTVDMSQTEKLIIVSETIYNIRNEILGVL